MSRCGVAWANVITMPVAHVAALVSAAYVPKGLSLEQQHGTVHSSDKTMTVGTHWRGGGSFPAAMGFPMEDELMLVGDVLGCSCSSVREREW
jgi:hypothetical protein